jgi:tetratricopeptide (TPR) repeat protein
MARAPRIALAALLSLVVLASPVAATCGGGGGGGMGGITPGGGAEGQPIVYRVPWQVVSPGAPRPSGALDLLWFPTSPEEARASSLVTSRVLSVWAGHCVSMSVVTADHADLRQAYTAPAAGEPFAVLAAPDGTELARATAKSGRLDTGAVEKMVRSITDAREKEVDAALADAKAKEKAGDAEAAAALYTQVWEQRCLFPSPAKKAAKGLERLGRQVPEETSLWEGPGARLDEETTRALLADMTAGLAAERRLDIAEAQRRYEAARTKDPGDPTPLRYLAELHRHHTGDWALAETLFRELLTMPVDPLSRAVALHGLGKMSIHGGQFAKGLALFEGSIRAYPLALTYRNLSVYWSSEGDAEKAYGYVQQAMALEPDDPYNQIFAATQYVVMGRAAEAEAIARRHEGMLEASYNLAAIWSQLGERERMLELLKRHFYEYERFDAVRRHEMLEARADIVFRGYHADPEFVALTSLATGTMTGSGED